LRKLIYY